MASNVSNAVGVAQQYMPQERELYDARLQGVQQNWNVTADYGKSQAQSDLAKTLNALGVSVGDYALDKEKKQYEIAQIYAKQAFNKLSDAEKKKLSTAEVLANVAEYNLQDNPYAVGVIDRMRGQYLNQSIMNEYYSWAENQPLPQSEEENGLRFEQFTKDKLEQYEINNHLGINNTFAFMDGLTANSVEDRIGVSKAYATKKDAELRRVRIDTTTAEIDKMTRSLQYNDKVTPEVFQKDYLMPLMTNINVTQRSNYEDEVKLLEYAYQAILKNTGRQDLLKAFGDMQAFNGKFVKDLVPPERFFDLAAQQADNMRTQQAVEDDKYLQSFSSKAALEEGLTKLQAEDPEKYRRVSPKVDRRIKEIDYEEKARQRAQLMAMKNQQKAVDVGGRIRQLVDNIRNGSFTGVPQSDKDYLDFIGGDTATADAVWKDVIEEANNNGETATLAKMALYPPLARSMKGYFDQHLEVDLRGGKVTPAVQLALQIAGTDGAYTNLIFGDKKGGQINALRTFIDSLGTEEGMQLFSEGVRGLSADPSKEQSIREQILVASNPTVDIFDIRNDSNSYGVSISDNYLTPEIKGDIDTYAMYLVASGLYDAQAAKQMATSKVLNGYVRLSGKAYMPKAYYNHLMEMGIRNEDIAYYSAYLQQQTGNFDAATLVFGRDANGFYMEARDTINNTTPQRVSGSKLENDLLYLANDQEAGYFYGG